MSVKIYKHEVVKDCGSFEVRYDDGKPSVYFYWDDVPSRRLRPETLNSKQALLQAQTFARGVRDGSK